MIEYVAGFMFDRSAEHVLLIQKTKPAWQLGKLNGIGGKIEADESPVAAMVREFAEESGIHTLPDDWAPIVTLQSESWRVYFFRATGRIHAAWTLTDEEVMPVGLPLDPSVTVVPNLRWLLPLAQEWVYTQPIVVNE